jgi:hypothetical protein
MASWSTVTVSGYNATPPPDDGSQVATNKVSWAGIKTKLTDPLNTAVSALNTSGAALGTVVDGLVTFTGFKNLCDNGDLEIWQRGAGGSASIAVAAGTGFAFTADGWSLFNGANQASVVSQQAGLTNGSRFCARVQRNNGQTGTTGMLLIYAFDSDACFAMRGATVTLSARVRAGSNWSPLSGALTLALSTGTGSPSRNTGGYTGGQADISTTTNISTSVVQMTGTATLRSTVSQAAVQVSWSPTGTAGVNDYFEIDEVQAEIASSATTFDRRPFAVMLQNCQRRFIKTFPYGTAPAQNAGVTGALTVFSGTGVSATEGLTWQYPTMRTTPTITTFNPSVANANWRDVTGGADRVVTVGTVSDSSVPISLAGGVAATTNQIHAQADADIT